VPVNHLDDSVLSTLRDVMDDEYPTLLEVFLKDSEERIQALHQLLRLSGPAVRNAPPHTAEPFQPDLQALGMVAHSFKGSSSNMGAFQLAELCRELEEHTRTVPPASPPALIDLTRRIELEYRVVQRLFDLELQLFPVRH
jgi:HPt (histidine-containing phosphotransfer) domain-containing protein